jgi:O-antigen/teichoic acid export membrane protein
MTGKERIKGLLRKSEHIFKTDMVYAAGGGFWLILGQIVSMGSSFLLAIAFAHLVSQEVYGTYRYILSVVGMFMSFSLSGLSPAVTRAVARGNEGTLLKSFLTNLSWSGLLATGMGLFALYYALHGNTVLCYSLLFAAAFAPFTDSFELHTSYLNGKKLFKVSSTINALRGIIATSVLILSLFLTHNPVLIVGTYFLIHFLITGYAFYYTYIRFKPNHRIDPDAKRLGAHVSIINGFAALADRVDNIILFHYFGPIQLAIYNFSLLIPTNILGLIKNIGTLAVPKLALKEVSAAKKTIVQKSFTLLLLTVPITLIYVFFAPILFHYFFPQYHAAIIYSQVFAITILMSGTMPLSLLDAQIALKEKYTLSVISNTIKITLIFVGIYYFGIWGAIIARIASKTIGLLTAYTLMLRMA